MQDKLAAKIRRQRTHKENGSNGRKKHQGGQRKKPRHRTGWKKTTNTAHIGGRGSKAVKKTTHERRVTRPRRNQSGSGNTEATELTQIRNLTPTRPRGERTEGGAGRRRKANKKSKGKKTEGYRKRNPNQSQNHARKAEEVEIKREQKENKKRTQSNNRTTKYGKKHGTRREGRAHTASWRRRSRTRTITQPNTKTTRARNARTKK